MANASNPGNSGEGTRPTTDGGVDNIGGADAFTPGKAETRGDRSPAPADKMAGQRKDKAAAEQDGSAPLGLRQSADSTPNTEPERPVRQR